MKKLLAFLLVAVMLFSFSSAYAWPGEYHHPRGYHYYGGHWWLGDAIVAGLAVGTILVTLPPHYSTVYVGNVPYYYDGAYYYQRGPSGYVVVQPVTAPVVVGPTPAVVVAQPVEHNRSVTVKISNKNGTVTEVMLVRKGSGYVEPQGEYYDTMPTTKQLKALYGK